ncbi:hypothetical protein DSO57_1019700 [Entomophthora muscae]|uniref:Uncharacterized protein n=1 Tax=Entomophthora muscae TaxID=34485 RepID=A0ACC2TR48_9FUNG|nr:hypothetical protein DSO57_1019700 [Entomophthora muscae]
MQATKTVKTMASLQEKKRRKMRRRQKLLSSQVTEKNLTASSNEPSPTIDLDPATKEPPEEKTSLVDPDAIPERYLPDKEEVNKDMLH